MSNSFLAGAPPPTPFHEETEMLKALKRQLEHLETWAEENIRESRRDFVNFWLFKIPVIIGSAGAGIFAYFEWNVAALVVGAIGSFCALVDGLYPRGMLHNIHLQAGHDLRNLQQRMTTQWEVGFLRSENPRDAMMLAAEIIENAQKEVEEIASYLKAAETSLGLKNRE